MFCDGQYVAGGDEVNACVEALAERDIEVEVDFEVGLDKPSITPQSFCRMGGSPSGAGWLGVLLTLGLVAARRRHPMDY